MVGPDPSPLLDHRARHLQPSHPAPAARRRELRPSPRRGRRALGQREILVLADADARDRAAGGLHANRQARRPSHGYRVRGAGQQPAGNPPADRRDHPRSSAQGQLRPRAVAASARIRALDVRQRPSPGDRRQPLLRSRGSGDRDGPGLRPRRRRRATERRRLAGSAEPGAHLERRGRREPPHEYANQRERGLRSQVPERGLPAPDGQPGSRLAGARLAGPESGRHGGHHAREPSGRDPPAVSAHAHREIPVLRLQRRHPGASVLRPRRQRPRGRGGTRQGVAP